MTDWIVDGNSFYLAFSLSKIKVRNSTVNGMFQ